MRRSFRSFCALYLSRKKSIRWGMSSRRFRSGGRNRHHVQPIKQILPELSLGDLLLKIDVGRGDHAHVHFDRLRIPHALELALLQHAQQFHLQLRLQRADLVQENRPVAGRFKPALLVPDGAGERTFHVTEQFALQQRPRQGPAIDPHETSLAPR